MKSWIAVLDGLGATGRRPEGKYPVAGNNRCDGDANGDVDSADMLVFLSQWTGAAAEASRVASVPEPSGIVLVGIAFAGLMGSAATSRRLVQGLVH